MEYNAEYSLQELLQADSVRLEMVIGLIYDLFEDVHRKSGKSIYELEVGDVNRLMQGLPYVGNMLVNVLTNNLGKVKDEKRVQRITKTKERLAEKIKAVETAKDDVILEDRLYEEEKQKAFELEEQTKQLEELRGKKEQKEQYCRSLSEKIRQMKEESSSLREDDLIKLQQKYDEAENELKNLRAEKERISDLIYGYEEDIRSQKAVNQKKELECERQRSTLRELEEKSAKNDNENYSLRAKIEEIKAVLDPQKTESAQEYLKKQLEELKQQKEELERQEREAEALRLQNDGLRGENEKAAQTLEILTQTFNSLEAECSSKKSECEQYEKELNELREQEATNMAECESLQAQIEELKAGAEVLHAELIERREEEGRQRQTYEVLRGETEETAQAIEVLTISIAQLKVESDLKKKECEQHQETLCDLRQKEAASKVEYEGLQAQIDELKAALNPEENKRLAEEVALQKENLTQQEQERDALKQTKEETEQLIKVIEDDIARLKIECKAKADTYKGRQDRLAELQEEVSNQGAECEALKAKIEKLEADLNQQEYESAPEYYNNKLSELKNKQQEYEELRRAIKEKEDELKTLGVTNDSLQKDLSKLKDDESKLNSEKIELREKIAKKGDEVQQLNSETENYRQQIKKYNLPEEIEKIEQRREKLKRLQSCLDSLRRDSGALRDCRHNVPPIDDIEKSRKDLRQEYKIILETYKNIIRDLED